MTALLLVVFFLQVVIHVVNSVGVATINEILWILFNKLPTPTSAAVRNANKHKGEVIRLKKEMSAVSAQDDFARWAKLRRQHDKATADYDKTAATIKSSRSQFDMVVSAARWLGTTGLRFLLQFWCAKTAIYWIPTGWLPYYAEWILSFPKAPLGSISIQSWWIACACVIQLASDAIIAARALAVGQKGNGIPAGQKEKMAFASGNSMGKSKVSGTGAETKGVHEKEL